MRRTRGNTAGITNVTSGGGGGGAARISYVTLPAYQPPPEARPEEQVEQRPQEIVIPAPTLALVDLEEPTFEIPRETAPIRGAEILGAGAGTGGGAGAGTGRGGGIGSGVGTGIGSAIGPGTGGDGGNIFLPSPLDVRLPLGPRPNSVRGKQFVFHFTVSAEGRVLDVQILPRIRDRGFRRSLMRLLREWIFRPGMTLEGQPIMARATVEMTL